jgi:hypothetical protein
LRTGSSQGDPGARTIVPADGRPKAREFRAGWEPTEAALDCFSCVCDLKGEPEALSGGLNPDTQWQHWQLVTDVPQGGCQSA